MSIDVYRDPTPHQQRQELENLREEVADLKQLEKDTQFVTKIVTSGMFMLSGSTFIAAMGGGGWLALSWISLVAGVHGLFSLNKRNSF